MRGLMCVAVRQRTFEKSHNVTHHMQRYFYYDIYCEKYHYYRMRYFACAAVPNAKHNDIEMYNCKCERHE